MTGPVGTGMLVDVRLPVDYAADVIEPLEVDRPTAAYLSPFNTPSELELFKPVGGRSVTIILHYRINEPNESVRLDSAGEELVEIGKNSKKLIRIVFHTEDDPCYHPPHLPQRIIDEVVRRLTGKESGQFVFTQTASLVNRVLDNRWEEVCHSKQAEAR
jgi:hypothetical protein